MFSIDKDIIVFSLLLDLWRHVLGWTLTGCDLGCVGVPYLFLSSSCCIFLSAYLQRWTLRKLLLKRLVQGCFSLLLVLHSCIISVIIWCWFLLILIIYFFSNIKVPLEGDVFVTWRRKCWVSSADFQSGKLDELFTCRSADSRDSNYHVPIAKARWLTQRWDQWSMMQ